MFCVSSVLAFLQSVTHKSLSFTRSLKPQPNSSSHSLEAGGDFRGIGTLALGDGVNLGSTEQVVGFHSVVHLCDLKGIINVHGLRVWSK